MPPKDPSVQFFAYIPSITDVRVDARYRDNRGLGRDRLMIIVGLASVKDHTMLIIYHSDRDNLSILSLITLLRTPAAFPLFNVRTNIQSINLAIVSEISRIF